MWEQGLGQGPIRQVIRLLAACFEESPEELGGLTIGQRDARLLTLRAILFGPELMSIATCPGCGEKLELRLNVEELRPRGAADASQEWTVIHAGCEATFRLPTSRDLLELRPDADVAANRRQLLERCLLRIERQGTDPGIEEEMICAIANRMAEADPGADIELDLTCPQCRHTWGALLDIGSFLWRELDAWAQRLLQQVHLLASAYGWSEAEILRLSPTRRQFYINQAAT